MGDRDKIFVQQTSFRLTLICRVDITGSLDRKIKYIKPDATTGFWQADSSNDELGYIYYDVVDTDDFDQAGTWILWSWVNFPDGRHAPGDPIKLEIYNEGDV